MSCHSQTTSGPSSAVNPSLAPTIVIFQLNQARREKVTNELEAVRSDTLSICSQMFRVGFDAKLSPSHTIIRSSFSDHLQHSWSGQPLKDLKDLSKRGSSMAR